MARRLLVMTSACMLAFACAPAPGSPSGPEVRQVEPRPDMANVGPVTWERADVGKDGRTLQVLWRSGPEPCFVLDRVEFVQSPQAVTVTLYEGRDPTLSADAFCPAILVTKATTVALDAPLGNRKVIDGSKGHGT